MPTKSKKKKAEQDSKKSAMKKKEKLVQDKTFGLKNKNKSSKVQAHIQSIKKNVMNSGDPKQRKMEEERKRKKADAKLRKKAMEEERNALFGEALLAVQKKNKSTDKKAGTVEAKGRDANDDSKKTGTSRAMKMMYQMDAKEMADKLMEDPNYVPTLEDEIDAQREKMMERLRKSGKKGTPVTEETFRAWQERKRKRHADEARKRVEAELKKKKGGKGLAVLSGRDLFEYKRDLFKDDDDDDVLERVEEEEEQNGVIESNPAKTVNNGGNDDATADLAAKVQSDLFLEGDDDDLDDIEDD